MSIRQVPFFRPSIGEDEIEAVVDCLRSGWMTTGPKARQFEDEFATALGGDVHAVAVNSATAAMHLALEAIGIGPGDEVILPTLTFTATAEVVRYLGAEPVLCDIDPASLCLAPDRVEPLINSHTKAIMPVHFGGRPCGMTDLLALADAYDLHVVDDAAHAFPAHHKGQAIGTMGTATAFSFYANKTITTGEGGMLVTRDPDIAKRARTMRLHGIDRDVFNRFTDLKASWRYDVVAPGFKYNLTDIAAAIGIHQLRRAEAFGRTRARLAARYDAALADLPVILPPHAAQEDGHAWHLYGVRLGPAAPLGRDDLILALQEAGIGCSVHYRPLHRMTVWAESARGRGQVFPAADQVYETCLSLPLFMDMRDDEQDHVIDVLQRLLATRQARHPIRTGERVHGEAPV